MRVSEAGLALIRRDGADGAPEYLAQWSESWQRFALVGGHREPGETFRACCTREVAEELHLHEGIEFRVEPEPVAPLCEYRAHSASAGVETLYRVELYLTELLTREAEARVTADPANRWLTEPELRRHFATADRKPISAQIETVLVATGVLSERGECGPAVNDTVNCYGGAPVSRATEVPLAAPPPERAPEIVWTHRAERQLRYELIRTDGSADALPDRLARLHGWLALAFPRAAAVVVLDVYLGFRPRGGEFVLFVDARGDTDCGTAIVKLADDEARLRAELAAWRSCTPLCFHGNAVFMGLSARSGGHPPRLVALVYQDAQPHIGTDETVWLESAVLRAVRFGVPDTHTVIDALRELFSHLGRVLYPAARVEPLETGGIELNPGAGGARRHLHDAFDRWDGPGAVGVRQQVSAAFGPEHTRYIDPVDYFRFLHAELNEPGARAEHLLPRRLRGPAHGDLHGRNVLVGLEEDRVGTPALFDYENMSCDNLLGWDFVKLETELKIRALSAVLWTGGAGGPAGRLLRFAPAVEAFETRLAERTVECRESGLWPEGPDPAFAEPRLGRLAALLLCVRQQAELHLGARRKRFRDWLHEYYFLLGCYGVTTVRFENQSESERAAALVSAGVAAVQYELGRPGAGPIGGAL